MITVIDKLIDYIGYAENCGLHVTQIKLDTATYTQLIKEANDKAVHQVRDFPLPQAIHFLGLPLYVDDTVDGYGVKVKEFPGVY